MIHPWTNAVLRVSVPEASAPHPPTSVTASVHPGGAPKEDASGVGPF